MVSTLAHSAHRASHPHRVGEPGIEIERLFERHVAAERDDEGDGAVRELQSSNADNLNSEPAFP
jgi:hypothetical protein